MGIETWNKISTRWQKVMLKPAVSLVRFNFSYSSLNFTHEGNMHLV